MANGDFLIKLLQLPRYNPHAAGGIQQELSKLEASFGMSPSACRALGMAAGGQGATSEYSKYFD